MMKVEEEEDEDEMGLEWRGYWVGDGLSMSVLSEGCGGF